MNGPSIPPMENPLRQHASLRDLDESVGFVEARIWKECNLPRSDKYHAYGHLVAQKKLA